MFFVLLLWTIRQWVLTVSTKARERERKRKRERKRDKGSAVKSQNSTAAARVENWRWPRHSSATTEIQATEDPGCTGIVPFFMIPIVFPHKTVCKPYFGKVFCTKYLLLLWWLLLQVDLFQPYFSPAVVKELCQNTNRYAAKHTAEKSYALQDVDVEEFYRFLGLVLFTSLVKLPSVQDYWQWDSIGSMPFPGTIMTCTRFESLSWNLHLSDVKDQENDRKKGGAERDKLFRVQPFLDHMHAACKASYHPRRELTIDERMVATKARTGFTQYMKNKPTKWGIKLFVLADSSNGRTVDFTVYVGKTPDPSAQGLSYDAVMNLVQPDFLGTGYHIYMENL